MLSVDVDINNVKEFVLSDKFRDFLMTETTEFGTAAFVLQTLLEKIDEIEAVK